MFWVWVIGDVWMGRDLSDGISAANKRPGLSTLTNEKLWPPAAPGFLYCGALQGPGHYYTWLIADASTHGYEIKYVSRNHQESKKPTDVFFLKYIFWFCVKKCMHLNVSAERMMMIMLWEVRTWWSGDYSLVLFRITNPMERWPGVIIALLHPHNTTIEGFMSWHFTTSLVPNILSPEWLAIPLSRPRVSFLGA